MRAIDEVDAGVATLDLVIEEKNAKKKALERSRLIDEAALATTSTRATQTSPLPAK